MVKNVKILRFILVRESRRINIVLWYDYKCRFLFFLDKSELFLIFIVDRDLKNLFVR